MTHTMNGTHRTYSPCQHPEAFVYRPVIGKGKGKISTVFVGPHTHREFWAAMWTAIKAQPWYEQGVGLVMVGSDGFAYCQYPGQTTGLARVYVGKPS